VKKQNATMGLVTRGSSGLQDRQNLGCRRVWFPITPVSSIDAVFECSAIGLKPGGSVSHIATFGQRKVWRCEAIAQ
jgi:hypothetical protein